MRRLLIVGLSLILIGFTGVSYAELTEQDISNISASLENILAQLNQGGIPEDEALAQIERIFNEQILPELPEGESVDFASLIPNIQEVFAMVTDALVGGGDPAAALAAATESLVQLLTNPTEVGSLPDSEIISSMKGKDKKKEEKKKPQSPPREPTIQGSIAGIEEIDGKIYVAVKADKVNIADGNGFQDAEGEVWLVEVDKDTAAELKDKIGEKIIISGDLQEDVDGHLTISLYTKEYLKEKYGIETDTDKFYAVGNDIEKYIAEMDKEG
ncbi:MAG: hypothetical protein DRP68_07090, partial [Candidatus Omnitrophota bacterium]